MSIIGDHLGTVLGLHNAHRSWTAAYNLLFPLEAPPQWESDVVGFMWERRYHVESIRSVLEQARAMGSVECCSELVFSDVDRAKVESYIPATGWGDECGGTWELGAGVDLLA